MRGDKAFFDTSVLIYVFAKDDPRAETAETLLAAGGVVGAQILNEFVAVALRKLAMPWKEVLEALSALRVLCPSPMPMTVATHDTALRDLRAIWMSHLRFACHRSGVGGALRHSLFGRHARRAGDRGA